MAVGFYHSLSASCRSFRGACTRWRRSRKSLPRADKPLLAAWSFDEASGAACRDASGNGRDAVVDPPSSPAVRREPGLFGNAMALSGNHGVRVSGKFPVDGLEKLSFSAWVMPTQLDGFREIFRKEDGNDRLLFSFQENGTILSLGLNVGGYIECDAPLAQYLTAADDAGLVQAAERLTEMALEYQPLTARQWQRLAPEDRHRWEAAAAIGRKLEQLKSQGQSARFSPGWIEVILAAGPQIQERPRLQEAVAPYVKPSTAETRTLTAEEGRQALERDWLHQADGQPAPRRVLDEIGWTRRIIERIAAARPGKGAFAAELERLAALEKQAAALKAADRGLYFQVRELKRAVMLKNPAVDFDRLLLVDMPFPQGSEWQHETRHRLGYMAVPGGKLVILQGLAPDGQVRQLMPQPPLHGSFWRPDLSFDATKVVFCYKPHNEKAFHLYEINVDGTGLVQLTDGIFDDLDPIYLPDGHILFSTTRGHTYVRCMPPTNAYSLARCDADGKNVYLVSYNNEPDYLPSVMNDGRVIYTRWEYTDKPLWRPQKLWTMNPDGTQVSTFWGNQSVWPDLVKDARSIPGSRRVMMTGSAHHNWFSGSVGIIDPDRGLNFPDGLTKVTADTPWPECGNGPVDPVESPQYHASGHYVAYYSPYPLSAHDFLVSASRTAGPMRSPACGPPSKPAARKPPPPWCFPKGATISGPNRARRSSTTNRTPRTTIRRPAPSS